MRVAVLVLSALVLAGCGGGDPAPKAVDPTSDEMCEFVTPAKLEEIFRTEFDDGEPAGVDGTERVRGFPSCRYSQLEAEPQDQQEAHNPWAPYEFQISVQIKTWRADQKADPLDSHFDGAGYDEVDGIDDLAGFGYVSGDYATLVVLTKLDGEDRYVEVVISPNAESTVEQARPIAELVLDEVDT